MPQTRGITGPKRRQDDSGASAAVHWSARDFSAEFDLDVPTRQEKLPSLLPAVAGAVLRPLQNLRPSAMKPLVPRPLFPASPADARSLLANLGAPAHLLRHVELVGEAADILIACFHENGVSLDDGFVRVGVALHDVGKIQHPQELTGAGDEHEPAGERMLLAAFVTPAVAKVCLSHARWRTMPVELEDLVIALADKLWKGVRAPELEERVLRETAARCGRAFWDLFVPFDSCFEQIAERGHARLERSRQAG